MENKRELYPLSNQNERVPLLPAENPPITTAIAARNTYIANPSYNSVPLGSTEEDDSDSTLLEYWRLIARHKRAIVFGALAGLILGFAVGIPMKPVFRAETTLEVLTLNGDFMNQKSSNPTSTSDGNFDTSEEETQAKLLEGNALLDRVIAKLDPSAVKKTGLPPFATSGWRSWVHLRERVEPTPRQKLLAKAANSLKVRPTTRTRVLEITVDSTDPQLAADFANTLTQEFIAQNIEARYNTTQSTGQWLHRELEDARSKLRDSENALQSYAATSGLIFTSHDEDTNLATEKLQQVQQNLSTATADRIAKQARFELAQKAPPESLGDVLNDDGLRDASTKINDLKGRLADASTVFAPESSKIQRMQAELAALRASFESETTDIIKRIENDYTEAIRKERLLAVAYDAQVHEVTGQDEKAIQYNILKRDVDSNRALYDTMLQQMKQASISSAIRAGNVRVVDPAQVPDLPVSPNFKVNSAMGLVLGLLASMAIVTMREQADRTLQQPGDIKLWTELSELGVIPNAAIGSRGAGYQYGSPAAGSKGHKKLPRKNSSLSLPKPAELLLAQQGSSISAEAFRSALTSILFISEEKNRPRVLVFTSANAADGKTTVVSNIAIAAAEIRMKVLLIDADIRRPRLHEVFEVNNNQGLVDLLTDELPEEYLDHVIRSTDVKNLSILPAGSPTHAASHLLYSPAWGALLFRLRKEYDMILIDTPPMLQMTDARVAARSADAVVLIARSNLTTRDAMIAARDRLAEDRIPVLGTILNDWNPKQSPNGYYGYYRNNYYHANHYHEGRRVDNPDLKAM